MSHSTASTGKVSRMSPHSRRRKTVLEIAGKVSYFLRHTLGLKEGERVAIISPNSTLYTSVTLGILRAGLVAVPLNPIYSADELVHPLKDSEIAAAFVFPAIVPTVRAGIEKAQRSLTRPNGQPAIWLMDDADSVADLKTGERDFLKALTDKTFPTVRVRSAREVVAFIVYSSGTSGKPKGVQLTHENLKVGTETLRLGSDGDVGNKQVAIAVLPMFHIFGLNLTVLGSFLTGMVVVVVPRFDIEVFCAAIQKYKVTLALVVPPMLLGLARHPAVSKYDLSSLRIALCGAAPLSRELGDEVERRLPDLYVTQGYGLSETSPVVSYSLHQEYRQHKGSCGAIVPGCRVRLVDDDGKDVGHEQGENGKPGELWVQGGIVMKGYLNNKAANDESLTPDHWFKTGDIAIYKNKHLYIVDRKKELIKYKGFQVPPAELEALILTHPDIADVAVVGVNDKEQATELPRAYVAPRPNVLNAKTASEEEKQAFAKKVVDWVGERVANHKKLRGGVVVIEEVPKSASGKILRRFLRDHANPK